MAEQPASLEARLTGVTRSLKLSRLLQSRLLRFLFVGGLGYFVNQGVLLVLYDFGHLFGLPPKETVFHAGVINIRDSRLLIASCVAVEAAILWNFLWHQYWTFKGGSRQPLVLRFIRFNVTSVGSPFISLMLTNTLTPFFGVHYLIANSLGILLGTTWNWLWASKVIWRKRLDPDNAGATPGPS